jgi:hypothetical protein
MTYDIDYFINKFEDIPEDKWCNEYYVDPKDETKRCSLGHCGCLEFEDANPEADALDRIFVNQGYAVSYVNDGMVEEYSQPTPKQRILAALKHIKETKQ